MILDTIQNLARYEGLHPNLDALIAQGIQTDFTALRDGDSEVIPGVAYLCVGESAVSRDAKWDKAEDFELRLTEAPERMEYHVLGGDGVPDNLGSFVLAPGVFALFLPGEEFRVTESAQGARAAVYRVSRQVRSADTASPLNHKGTVELRTQRLLLRPYREGDEEAMYRNWCSDPEVTKTLMWETHPSVEFTRRLLHAWLSAYQSGRAYHWGIEETGELVGDIAVMRQSDTHLDCEIGYCLARKAWNHGVMTEALRAVTRFLFDEVGFHRVTLRHDTQNPASGRVMQKAGFRMEGVMRESLRRKDGTFADVPLYAALRHELDGVVL